MALTEQRSRLPHTGSTPPRRREIRLPYYIVRVREHVPSAHVPIEYDVLPTAEGDIPMGISHAGLSIVK